MKRVRSICSLFGWMIELRGDIMRGIVRTVSTISLPFPHTHIKRTCPVLWPLFHYLLWQDAPAESTNVDSDWQDYLAANESYADQVAAIYQPGDLVWIHDYHLLLVPAMLRKLKPEASIGLFVHTPFPSSEVFRCLPSMCSIFEFHASLFSQFRREERSPRWNAGR
jgi:hypothetical protein